ncbi:MAG: 23S rRNA (guanosine(2251)-2'-O)-methyltransferase RlmB [Candidatus Aminicenantes bacterium]|jgi:23S rRNA (guanosine2251-2'-O)-methyltransferase|nr:23S rRNA (guanosine(2251)-2'-O)-methyltransferase RlmB [Candidatus Aminicenantes bacterium]
MDRIGRLNPLIEVLKSSPNRINKILIQDGKKQKKIDEIIQLAKAKQIPFLFVPRQRLGNLDRNHQGAVALISPKEFSSLDDIFVSDRIPFLLLLDGIKDPQNLGAIIRTAEGAGVDGIILPERRSVGLSETVSLVSAGALEYLKVARVKNLARVMDDLRDRGIWLVGAEGGYKELWDEFDYKLPVGLVLGSEGKGLRPLIRKKCDKILSIPLLGRMTSLNVSAAASIFLYEVVRQRENIKDE